MKILALETSTKTFSLAVSDGERILKKRNIRLKKVLSSSIIPGIADILKKSGVPLKKLDGFAVGLGPGSFTSLRVGLSTVKGLAFAGKKPVVGIPSLDVLAMNVNGRNVTSVCTLCDAKRNLAYACFFKKQNKRLKRTSEYLLAPIYDILSRIKEDTLFIGDGIPLFREEILKYKGKKWKPSFAEEKLWFPSAERLAPLAYQRFKTKEFDGIGRLSPLYLYPEDCQVRQEQVKRR